MSSRRRVRRRQCGHKARHATEANAWIAARKTAPTCRPYKCNWCQFWHVGNYKPTIKRM